MDNKRKQILQRRDEHKHELKRKKKRKNIRKLGGQNHDKPHLRKLAKCNNTEVFLELVMPEAICDISAEDSNSLLRNINQIEEKIKKGTSTRLIFNFEQTRMITVGGAAIIKACFDKIRIDQPEIQVEINVPIKQDKIRQILQYIGIKNYGIEITHEDISRWVVKTHDCEIDKANLIKDIHEPIQKLTNWNNDEKIENILAAIPEACWNRFEHGYQLNDVKKSHKGCFTNAYLIFGETDYSFCIFDRGMGFRGSFQYYRPASFYKILERMKNKTKQEQLIIEKAIKLGQ